jgi:hypothetical protein
MNTLVDSRPVFSKASMSYLAAAPDEAPVSMIPVQQFDYFCSHFADILFCGQEGAVVDLAPFLSIWGGGVVILFYFLFID